MFMFSDGEFIDFFQQEMNQEKLAVHCFKQKII